MIDNVDVDENLRDPWETAEILVPLQVHTEMLEATIADCRKELQQMQRLNTRSAGSSEYVVEGSSVEVKEKTAEDIAWLREQERRNQDNGFELMVRASQAILKPETLDRLCSGKSERAPRAASAMERRSVGPRAVAHHTEIIGNYVGLSKSTKKKKPLVFGRNLPKEARSLAFGQRKVHLPRHDENHKARRLRSATGHTRRAFSHNAYDTSQISNKRAESAKIGHRLRREAVKIRMGPRQGRKEDHSCMLRKITNHADNGGGVHARHEIDQMEFYQWAGELEVTTTLDGRPLQKKLEA